MDDYTLFRFDKPKLKGTYRMMWKRWIKNRKVIQDGKRSPKGKGGKERFYRVASRDIG